MKRWLPLLWLLVAALMISSCSSTRFTKEYKQKYSTGQPNLVNDYHNLRFEKLAVPFLDSLLTFAQFNGTATPIYTEKAMYDHFGIWNQFDYNKLSQREFIMWDSIDIPNVNTPVNIIATGEENVVTTMSSFAAIDALGNDLLLTDSPLKTQLIEYLSNLIKENNENNKEFYRKYWQTRDPQMFRVMVRDGKFNVDDQELNSPTSN